MHCQSCRRTVKKTLTFSFRLKNFWRYPMCTIYLISQLKNYYCHCVIAFAMYFHLILFYCNLFVFSGFYILVVFSASSLFLILQHFEVNLISELKSEYMWIDSMCYVFFCGARRFIVLHFYWLHMLHGWERKFRKSFAQFPFAAFYAKIHWIAKKRCRGWLTMAYKKWKVVAAKTKRYSRFYWNLSWIFHFG